MRRDQINSEIINLRDLLPLPETSRQRLSQLQIMSLGCIFIRKCNYFNRLFGNSSFHAEYPFDFSQSLTGFLLGATRDGKLLYVSENVTEYLGHSMVDMMTQGDCLYDIIDKRDHTTVQSHLLSNNYDATTPNSDIRSFFCRMNVSRSLRRASGMNDQKVMHVRGQFIQPLICDHYSNQTVFVAVCSPVITPDTKETAIQCNTMVFKSVHGLDMKYQELEHRGEYHLGCLEETTKGKSWYEYVHPLDLQEAKDKHMHLIRSSHEMGSMLTIRMLTSEGSWIWVNVVMHIRQPFVSDNGEAAIVCVNQVISEYEAQFYNIHSQLYSSHFMRNPELYYNDMSTSGMVSNSDPMTFTTTPPGGETYDASYGVSMAVSVDGFYNSFSQQNMNGHVAYSPLPEYNNVTTSSSRLDSSSLQYNHGSHSNTSNRKKCKSTDNFQSCRRPPKLMHLSSSDDINNAANTLHSSTSNGYTVLAGSTNTTNTSYWSSNGGYNYTLASPEYGDAVFQTQYHSQVANQNVAVGVASLKAAPPGGKVKVKSCTRSKTWEESQPLTPDTPNSRLTTFDLDVLRRNSFTPPTILTPESSPIYMPTYPTECPVEKQVLPSIVKLKKTVNSKVTNKQLPVLDPTSLQEILGDVTLLVADPQEITQNAQSSPLNLSTSNEGHVYSQVGQQISLCKSSPLQSSQVEQISTQQNTIEAAYTLAVKKCEKDRVLEDETDDDKLFSMLEDIAYGSVMGPAPARETNSPSTGTHSGLYQLNSTSNTLLISSPSNGDETFSN